MGAPDPAAGAPAPAAGAPGATAPDAPTAPADPGVADPDGDVAGTPAGVPGAVTPPTGSSAAPVTGPEPVERPSAPAAVGRPDLRTRRAAVALVDGLALPPGGLGRLGELGVWLAACQGECPPRPPVNARVLLLAADHGVAADGVSAYPPEVSAARAEAAAAGRLPVTVAARAAGAAVRTVDVGLTRDADGVESGHRVARGTGRIDREDALTDDDAAAAWRTGRQLADEEIDAGADVLVPATLAVGATTPAATLVAALTGAEPVAVVGRASGIDDRAWMRKAVAIRDGLRRARPHLRDPLALLRTVGGTDLIVLAGFLARAAERKVPTVLDGVAVGAAALMAEELAPGAKQWWLAAQPSTEPAAGLVLEHLALTPVLDLAVRTEDGTAGVAVLPLLTTAARLLGETGTAEDTGVVPGDATAAAGATR
ncbi:nicotinate-nucleotide--dimethylbenzimidazole phosphoribosyltransferase [Pseudonocardia kongjuensis]|uniref:nicotinate-nucleotide--dimethylbenzimidazole phosphoribosyltransferase n=1 Tax=Pseudonocardia kongjuensis TaxID=102227 RepID=UPI0031D96C89